MRPADRFVFCIMVLFLFAAGCTSPLPEKKDLVTDAAIPSVPDPGDAHLLMENEIAVHRFDARTSYELSVDNFTIRPADPSMINDTYIGTFHVTVKNTGSDPIDVIFQTSSLRDSAGLGCQSRGMSWCGTLILGRVDPGKSRTGTEEISLYSAKAYDELSSEPFRMEGVISADSETTGGVNTRGWILQMKKSSSR